MKRLAAILILTLTLVSCASTDADPLAYQQRAADVTAALTTDTGTFSLVISLPEMTDTSRLDAEIRLTAPSTLDGITVSVKGEVVTISSGDTTLPLSPAAAERWLRLVGLFSLDSSATSSVTDNNGTVTVGVGGSPDRVFVSFRSGSDIPDTISTEDGSIALKIEEYKFRDTENDKSEETGG